MKVCRMLSSILFGIGCAITFIGLLALLLPCVDNAQLRLVLDSFDLPSEHPVVSLMNRGMSYVLHNSWQVLFLGMVLLAAGLILLLIFTREPKRFGRREYTSPPPAPAYAPQWEQPAPSEPESNPFANAALWEHQFAPAKRQDSKSDNPFSVFGGPILEPNRIDDKPVPNFTLDSYPLPTHEEKPVREVPVSAQPAPISAPTAQHESMHAKAEPVYTPNEEPNEPTMLSSRIRSTIGRKREW